MNILLTGSGGREHALAWKMKQSPHCGQLFIAPGNAGTAMMGTNVNISSLDFEALATFSIDNNINMLVVGPEEPLVNGIYDFFGGHPVTAHIKVIGPSKAAAKLEGSKAFAKEFMNRNGIPTAAYKKFNEGSYLEGVDYIKAHTLPIVLKADGLAAGKGVVICTSYIEALAEFELMIQQSKFGEAGKSVVVEEFLTGIEVSMFVLTDNKGYKLLPEAKDYKRIGRNDTGPNTGGMGAVSPVPFMNEVLLQKVKQTIIEPTIMGLQKEKLIYKGVIFIGLIIVNNEPFVIEYNCRFGDPETEVILPRLDSDLVSIFNAISLQQLNEIEININPLAAATVVAVSGGYPNDYEKGKPINGLNDAALEGTTIFHAGTLAVEKDIVTNGGRVLAITSVGETIKDAVEQSNYVMDQISFEEMYYRNDIGFEFP